MTISLSKMRGSQWCTFTVMLLMLFCKSATWHFQLFGDNEISLVSQFFTALWLSVWVLPCKRRPWWSLAIFFVANLWMFSCFVYYKVWGVFVTMDEVRILDNLRGFESSIFADWRWEMLLWLALPDMIYCCWLAFSRPSETKAWRGMLIVLAFGLMLVPARQFRYHRFMLPRLEGYNPHEGFRHYWYEVEPLFNIYHQPCLEAKDAFDEQRGTGWEQPYVHRYGILDYGIAMMVFDHRYSAFEAEVMNEPVVLTAREKELMKSLCQPESGFMPERSLVVIMVESFETWAMYAKGSDGSWVMPNLRRFMEENNTFFVPETKMMILRGGSSDGQLMLLTGLAPAAKGVTVALHGDQPYPNFAHYYPSSRTLNPSPGVWKQQTVNPRYGIKILEESDSIRDDQGLFHRLNALSTDSISFTLLITVSSHVPFTMADNVDYEIGQRLPEKAARYLKCLHYLDAQLGTFLSRVKSEPALRNTDIVITADHSIMFEPDLKEIEPYAVRNGINRNLLDYGILPLIIYSPTFTESRVCDYRACQVDIYPTILGVMGCENPAWKGVGIDLLQNSGRTITPDEAYQLSDKLIRGKWFGR